MLWLSSRIFSFILGAITFTDTGAAQIFPVMGEVRAFTGNTRNSVPNNNPGTYRVANSADWYYEWPTPTPVFSFTQFRNERKVGKNQEPGFYACRPTTHLPQGCGRPHQGLDIYAHYGTPIVAPEDGVIVSYKGSKVLALAGSESKSGGDGRLFRLRGDSGHFYTFLHTMGFSETVAEKAGVSKDFGETSEKAINIRVNAGDVIGYVGCTGGILNPHLHLQVTYEGHDVNPASLFGKVPDVRSEPGQ
jgi:murein DD-endopeptidase MepM/ murein hydrolase activator NlpD